MPDACDTRRCSACSQVVAVNGDHGFSEEEFLRPITRQAPLYLVPSYETLWDTVGAGITQDLCPACGANALPWADCRGYAETVGCASVEVQLMCATSCCATIMATDPPTPEPTTGAPTTAPASSTPTVLPTPSPSVPPTWHCATRRTDPSSSCAALCPGRETVGDCRCCTCAAQQYLSDGECVDRASCEAGGLCRGVGRGNFNRQCICDVLPAGQRQCPCDRRTSLDCHCHDCDGAVCRTCANSRFLLDGACEAVCPAGYDSTGNGRFGLGCAPAVTTPEPTPTPGCLDRTGSRISGCYSCDAAREACTRCRFSQYLHDGACVPCCPDGTCAAGTGRYNRVCRPPASPDESCPTGCGGGNGTGTVTAPPRVVCEADDCLTCQSDSRSVCQRCRNGRYLHEGMCLPGCVLLPLAPGESGIRGFQGFQGRGNGRFGAASPSLYIHTLYTTR